MDQAPHHARAAEPDRSPRGFGHVETWIFDLDNTLYPHEARVWPQVDDRITAFIADLYGLDGLSARALQKYFYHRYGTTLKALMDEDGIDPAAFLDFAHDIDHSSIELNPLLGSAIEALPGRKLILTNGTRSHAERVAMKLGIFDHFEDVFDIVAANYVPKPDRRAYEVFLERHAVDPAAAAMFEDIARNLAVPYDLGMTTTLVVPKTLDPFRERHEQEAVSAPYIDHVTQDLAGFLSACAPASGVALNPRC
jgi:putative hydrolase of the HAD superfamily